jgi:hypothetical protein
MVGLGHLEGDTFRVRQFVLGNPGSGKPFWERVGEELRRFSVVVSFNGKCFDFPQVRTRMDFHRLPHCLPGAHVDLLYPARRLWRESLPSCDLGTLERSLLGVMRPGDVPGHLIPALYFRYLFGGDRVTLEPIVLHNCRDILSLAALSGVVWRTLETGPADGSDAPHLYSLGREILELGDVDRGIDLLENSIRLGLPPELEARARLQAARCLRRHGQQARAKEHLLDLLRAGVPEAFVELAKVLEHCEKDAMAALELVNEGLSRGFPGETLRRDLERRKERLEKKGRHRVGGGRGQGTPEGTASEHR